MELRQLRYFVEIALAGSFTRAAETLSVAQPALTAQIHKLEAEFAAQLFVRTTRGVTLTAVGEVVFDQAKRTLDAADATQRSAELAAAAANARIIVGFTRIYPFLPIARTVRRVRREYPKLRIELREMWSNNQIDALLTGAIDIGFVHYTYDDEDRDLAIIPVAEETMTVAISDHHRLATRRQIALEELADEDFLVPSQTQLGETVRDEMLAACARAGFVPRVVQESSDIRILLGLVSAGLGIAILASSSRDVKVRAVHYLSVTPKHTIRFAAMHRRGSSAKLLQPFLERIERGTFSERTPGREF